MMKNMNLNLKYYPYKFLFESNEEDRYKVLNLNFIDSSFYDNNIFLNCVEEEETVENNHNGFNIFNDLIKNFPILL